MIKTHFRPLPYIILTYFNKTIELCSSKLHAQVSNLTNIFQLLSRTTQKREGNMNEP